MKKVFSTPISMLLLVVLFFALVLLNNQIFRSARFDLTEDKVYSLSDGSKEIINGIDEPVHLYFFFSDKTSEGLTSLRNYANRVESLLKEYANASDGKIQLHLVDPEPFSEAEDQASEFGLTAAMMPGTEESIYFGLAGRNSLDDQQVIGFFDPQKERFLEYDISQLIYLLSEPEPLKVGLLSGISVTGGQNPMTGQFDPPWHFYAQLQELYDVETLPAEFDKVPEDVGVLLLIHPQDLSEKTLYAIDQFVMAGGKLLTFVDPHHESDPMAAMSGMASANTSSLSRLFDAWGIRMEPEQVVLDAAKGLDIRTQKGVTKHVGFIGLDKAYLDENDVITSSLDMINGASFGSLELAEGSQLEMHPLLHSSEYSTHTNAMVYAMTRDPDQLMDQMTSTEGEMVLGARFQGNAKSAFDKALAGNEQGGMDYIAEANINVVVIADTDVLADRFWVSQANFFGQTVFTPFADNGALLTNAVENMAGSDSLISIRSRGTYARPFTKVQELTAVAEMKFMDQEKILEQQLNETEAELSKLQSQQMESGALTLSKEQEEAIKEFNEKRIEIRKELREVRHQLDKDIESLGSRLKFLNIALMPILLVLMLAFVMRSLRTRYKS
ncbi:Gldg family protein [Paraneptunicella aestuarii]|uniref:Gldg family protein n=1 Tax=Paraneptunicella aestuarii TaxID=2831148 RepID=UPI001E382CF6|nr:Gldg family protein [Paraneptunicella aestuarii]UAA37805.1 Gldg family protein [Paraneptunicella aestuarii]